MKESEIESPHVREPTLHNGPIELHDYDPEWRKHFNEEKQRIQSAVGDNALRIEHVGSTSIQGLVAKPVIDIILVVQDSADEDSYVSDMERAGYVLHVREPAWHEHRLFKRPTTNVNVHVFSTGCAEIDRMIDFRDWLRIDKSDRVLYEQTKKRLATTTFKYVQNYADAKTEVVEEIIVRARSGLRRN